ncbi:DUF2184 domain-containing protein [Listeria grandensis]|uniref:DUF2184 domain-containing protein n=1 Tax=Listeria grandensis TaxID=1494963 RepID=A0A7X1CNN9_9LIST|nr:DUF2184 domain-containing protein [Listeria grandensis]MBC1935185.1 DUF2184 domain-containing protein [Listeria grandensis]
MGTQATATLQAQDLESIDKVLYQAKEDELTARTLFSIKTDIPAGARTHTYRILSRSGAAKIIANGADDLPLVDADLTEHTIKIHTIAAGFKYSIHELRESQEGNYGTPIDATRAATARKAIAEKENRIVWQGEAKHNIVGVCSTPGIQVLNASATGTGNSTKFADKTSEQIIEDFRQARKKVVVLPGYSSLRLSVAVPADQYEELGRRYSDYDSRTILEVLQSRPWFKTIRSVSDLVGVGTGGTDSMLLFDDSPETMEMLIPMDITQLQAEWSYPNWKIPVEERCGGVLIRFPMAVVRVDGI